MYSEFRLSISGMKTPWWHADSSSQNHQDCKFTFMTITESIGRSSNSNRHVSCDSFFQIYQDAWCRVLSKWHKIFNNLKEDQIMNSQLTCKIPIKSVCLTLIFCIVKRNCNLIYGRIWRWCIFHKESNRGTIMNKWQLWQIQRTQIGKRTLRLITN